MHFHVTELNSKSSLLVQHSSLHELTSRDEYLL